MYPQEAMELARTATSLNLIPNETLITASISLLAFGKIHQVSKAFAPLHNAKLIDDKGNPYHSYLLNVIDGVIAKRERNGE